MRQGQFFLRVSIIEFPLPTINVVIVIAVVVVVAFADPINRITNSYLKQILNHKKRSNHGFLVMESLQGTSRR